jgi:two-component system response regulator HydG
VKRRILVVDDDPGVRYALAEAFTADYDVATAVDGQDALDQLRAHRADLVLADLRMPRLDGMGLLRATRLLDPPPRLVMITAHGSERHAVEALQAGAYDYFKKPFDLDEITAVVNRAFEAVKLQHDNERLASALDLAQSMVVASEPMAQLAVLVRRIAPRDVNVLITGESGTGKERIADAIVRGSRRKDRPYVRFNCAALTAELAEAELFGHTRGAFTGAIRERPGLFREADTGTLLLDEVGELDLATQGKLLRTLQEGEIRPVGSDRPVKVDVRVLAATHRDLRERVAAGQFRDDLYWRLDVVRLHVPALRERPADIPALARHFIDRYTRHFGVPPARVSEALLGRLAAWTWPGNVRELEHAIEQMIALSADGELDLDLLPAPGRAVEGLDLKSRMDAYERGMIVDALHATDGNRTEAAKQLGISRVTLHEKLRKHGIKGAIE